MGTWVIFSLALLREHMCTFLLHTYLRIAGSESIYSLALVDISDTASVSTLSAVSERSGGSRPHQRLVSFVFAFRSHSGSVWWYHLVVLMCVSLKTNGELLVA